MDTVFLLTNGNMGGTAGDATLILRRARAMYSEKELFTKIILYKPLEQGNINTGDYYYSIDECQDKGSLLECLLKEKPKYLILYGDKIQMMTSYLRKFILKKNLRTKIIVDIQGAVEEKKEYSTSFIRRHVIYPLSVINFRKAVNNADGAFVVSDEIMEKCENALNSKCSLKYYKIRCGTERVFSFDEISRFRSDFRARKGLSNDTMVFCYSGYRSGWQKVDTIIEHFIKFDKVFDNCYFAFFCNTDPEFENALKHSFPEGNYCVELLKPEEYFKSLCGCDIGYILRDYNETNRVAFPNKFSDYITSGLIIALNNAIPEPMRLLSKYDKHLFDTDKMSVIDLKNKLEYRFNDYSGYIEESIELCETELLYSSQVKRTDL